MNIENEIKVSVCVVTYNQESYIAECLESLVTQQTNFKYEIIVGEDCSTDGTRSIIERYVKEYPELVVPLFHEKNVGPVENLKRTYKKARGKYIAHLDGDDAALPQKLQRQYDVLQHNSDCSICVHNMKAVDKYSIETERTFQKHEETKYRLLDLYLKSPLFVHSSKMFVNKLSEYIDQMDENALDLEFHIEQAKQGNIYVLEEVLGVYRQFVGVTYQNNIINEIIPKRVMSVFNNVNMNFFSKKEREILRNRYSYILLKYAIHYLIHNDLEKSKFFLRESFGQSKNIFNSIFFLIYISPQFFRLIFLGIKKIKDGGLR
ncbi:glycosyltransferase family 2 protein [Acinetobacter piscicola]|uniref:glycosyltransferase family 2 protein n=1 Tax=Acinetobacter piscicola TaxID=2006115 RepID=UPI0035572B7C